MKVGCRKDRKWNKSIKFAHPVGKNKQIEIFLRFNIITDYKHHVLCKNCFNDDIKQLNIPARNEIDKPHAYDELIQYLMKHSRKKLVNEEKNGSTSTRISLSGISIEECRRLCGLIPDDIYDIAGIIHQNSQHILEFFTICRQNMSQRAAAVIFGYKTHSSVSSHFNNIFESLLNDFVPIHIGCDAFTREDIKRNTPDLFKKLFPNVVGIIDGTYLYCKKSKCFEVQRKTWSEHKRRNLVKIMGVQFANGVWFDLMGPFYADGDHNDASIWNYIVEKDIGNIHYIFDEEVDEFIGDRGFRDIDEERFTIRIPFSLAKNQVQLSTQDANATRKITKLRNCIERGFGRLKQWKIINSVVDTNLVSRIGSLLRILGAIDNKYFPPLFIPTDTDEQDIDFIQHREVIPNVLENLPTNGWITRQLHEIIDLKLVLSVDAIRQYGLGDYALKLALPYLQHASDISIKTHKSKHYSNIIKIEGITSRYSKKTSPKHHKVFLQFPDDNERRDSALLNNYDNEDEFLLDIIKSINSYCSCKSGARTVGACAHVIATLYWLYANINDIPIPHYSAKLIDLQDNITNLQPFNEQRRKQKVNNDSVMTNVDTDYTDKDELYIDTFLNGGSRKKRKTN
jgi:hypothetical protein